jgi:hypothetical protein
MMLWTKLEGSLLAKSAIPFYEDSRRAYHILDHIRRMFAWAHYFKIPYDEELDKAIWAHDVIMDPLGNSEVRSKNFLLAIDPTAIVAGNLILTTQTHALGDDNRLILLDLADFLNGPRAAQNTTEVILEHIKMNGHTPRQDILKKSYGYLSNLAASLDKDIRNGKAGQDKETFRRIQYGIQEIVKRISWELS